MKMGEVGGGRYLWVVSRSKSIYLVGQRKGQIPSTSSSRFPFNPAHGPRYPLAALLPGEKKVK